MRTCPAATDMVTLCEVSTICTWAGGDETTAQLSSAGKLPVSATRTLIVFVESAVTRTLAFPTDNSTPSRRRVVLVTAGSDCQSAYKKLEENNTSKQEETFI